MRSCGCGPETSAPPCTPTSPLVLSCSEDTWQEHRSGIQRDAQLPSAVWLLAQPAGGHFVFPSETRHAKMIHSNTGWKMLIQVK